MNISRVFFSAVAFCVALIVGFKTGTQINLIEKLLQLSSDTESAPDSQIPSTPQFNLVIIGVTDINNPEPQLECVWLAAYSEITHKMTFMPVFPTSDNPERNLFLAEAFSLDQGKPSEFFWNALRTNHLWWDGYILSDRITAIEIVDLIDGVYVNDMLMNGNQVVNNIISWKENPQLAAEKQGILLEGICNRVVQTNTMDSKSAWEVLLHNPAKSNIHTILQVVKWGLKFRENQDLTCEFPLSGEKQATLISQ